MDEGWILPKDHHFVMPFQGRQSWTLLATLHFEEIFHPLGQLVRDISNEIFRPQ